MKVGVVGAGVVGLSSAFELADGHDVTVMYDEDLLVTTSAIATAIWHVYLVDPDDKQNLRWSERTLERLIEIHKDDEEAAVELIPGVELFAQGEPERPSWADIALGFEMLDEATVANEYPGRRWGYQIAAPTVNMKRYLPWLEAQCKERGVSFRRQEVRDLSALTQQEFDLVVNCAGFRAGDLTHDPELFPVRGQYLILKPDGVMPDFYVGDDEHPDGMAYMIPRDDEIMVGGTEEDGLFELSFSESVPEMIERASAFCPGLLDKLDIKERVVGLRPCRSSQRPRFGFDDSDGALFHNYGHGGSGFSLSWGCAEDLAHIVAGGLSNG